MRVYVVEVKHYFIVFFYFSVGPRFSLVYFLQALWHVFYVKSELIAIEVQIHLQYV